MVGPRTEVNLFLQGFIGGQAPKGRVTDTEQVSYFLGLSGYGNAMKMGVMMTTTLSGTYIVPVYCARYFELEVLVFNTTNQSGKMFFTMLITSLWLLSVPFVFLLTST